MAITKVWIEPGCVACATCEGICPEVFMILDKAVVIEDADFEEHEEGIKEAADYCPRSIIKYE